MKNTSLIAIFYCFLFSCNAQVESTTEKVELNEPAKASPIEIAQKYLGKPYVAGTLENPEEKLVCNLDEFDCFTLVENALALANSNNEQEYQNQLTQLRYRNGQLNGYTSRIHYFSEWAVQAQANGYVTDITPELGVERHKKINFMSTHRQYYPAFKTDNGVLAEIKEMEQNHAQNTLYEIPKNQIASVESQIKTGDIIGFTSALGGLDVNHVGFAYWKGNKLHFLHASSEHKKVEISDETLQAYINRIKKHSGLMVLRPQY